MATIKSYTNIEQSKKLAEILLLESADYHYIAQGEKSYFYPYSLSSDTIKDYDEEIKYIPCWSLAALLDVLPKNVKSPFGEVNPFVGQVNTKDYRCVYLDGDWDSNIQTFAKNPIDACYEMIINLKEKNLL